MTRLVKQTFYDVESLVGADRLMRTLLATHDTNHHVSVNEELCVIIIN